MAGAAQGILDFIHGIKDRQVQHQVDQAETNYLADPEGTIKQVFHLSPSQGFALQDRQAATLKAQNDAQSAADKAHQDEVEKVIGFTHGLAPGGDPDAVLASLDPNSLGVRPESIAAARAVLKANPGYMDASDKDRWKMLNTPHVIGQGATLAVGTTPVFHQGMADKVNVMGSPKTGYQLQQTPVDPIPTGPISGATPTGTPGISTIDPDVAAAHPTALSHPELSIGGVDPYAHNIKKEGGTNPDGSGRTSKAGAQGAGQIMPGTGPEAAAAAGLTWDPARNLNDPQYSVALGRAYHAVQIARFGGDLRKADAAYNAGPGRVARAISSQHDRWLAALPAETQGYVRSAAPGAFGGQASPTTVAAAPPAPTPGASRTVATMAPEAAPQFRSATPEELKGYPEGTMAQVGEDHKLVNLRMPPAGKGGSKAGADPASAYVAARTDLLNLKHSLADITGDNDALDNGTGLYGAVMHHIPGTTAARLAGKIATAKGQALNSAVTSLKNMGGGNLGFRMSQAEAQAFGNSLAGPLENTNQDRDSYVDGLTKGMSRIDQKIAEMDAAAVRSGIAAKLPNGALIMKGDKYKGHTYLGGDPSAPTSWKN